MCVSFALVGLKCQTIPKVSIPVSRTMCEQKGISLIIITVCLSGLVQHLSD